MQATEKPGISRRVPLVISLITSLLSALRPCGTGSVTGTAQTSTGETPLPLVRLLLRLRFGSGPDGFAKALHQVMTASIYEFCYISGFVSGSNAYAEKIFPSSRCRPLSHSCTN